MLFFRPEVSNCIYSIKCPTKNKRPSPTSPPPPPPAQKIDLTDSEIDID